MEHSDEVVIEPAFETIPSDAWWIVRILSEAAIDIATRRAITVWRYLNQHNQAMGSDCQEVFLGHLEYAFDCASALCQAGANVTWCNRVPVIQEL